MVVTGANGGTGSMFANQTYYDQYSETGNYVPPIGFGTTTETLKYIMTPGSQVWSFQLSGGTTPTTTMTFTGEAMAVWSSLSSTSYNTPKPREDVPFSLTFTEIGSNWVATPEPDTLILFLTGAAFVLAAGILKSKKRAARNGS
jgi:hypothetical protein